MVTRHAHLVGPIKDPAVLEQVKDTLLNNFQAGRRNYTVFQVGKATLLRVSDVLSLRYTDVFENNGAVKIRTYTRDQKTGKPNTLYLKPVRKDLKAYHTWLKDTNLHSEWLFPSTKNDTRHITRKQYYKIMARTGDLLGINYLGTHTMRKTGAYKVYQQTDHNIALVMRLLNHSDQSSTLKYLGLDQTTREAMLDSINFD